VLSDPRAAGADTEVPGTSDDERPGPDVALLAARRRFLAGQRVEMRTLASELGIGRSTLYRWFGDRDRLIGEMIWQLLTATIRRAEAAADERGLRGADRILALVAGINREVRDSKPLRRFLTVEPEAALRVLTTKHGGVQPRVIRHLADEIRAERGHGELKSEVDATALAYAVVRVSEGFLYADQITDTPVDLDAADTVLAALLR
jgi:AcrR family transcriptional regulator